MLSYPESPLGPSATPDASLGRRPNAVRAVSKLHAWRTGPVPEASDRRNATTGNVIVVPHGWAGGCRSPMTDRRCRITHGGPPAKDPSLWSNRGGCARPRGVARRTTHTRTDASGFVNLNAYYWLGRRFGTLRSAVSLVSVVDEAQNAFRAYYPRPGLCYTRSRISSGALSADSNGRSLRPRCRQSLQVPGGSVVAAASCGSSLRAHWPVAAASAGRLAGMAERRKRSQEFIAPDGWPSGRRRRS